MRVSTALLHSQGVQSMLDKQAELMRLQNQVSSGKRILAPSDDPSGVSRLMGISEAQNQIKQYDENINYARQRLGLEESKIESSLLVLQRVRELALQAANTGTYDSRSQQQIASEVKEKLQELFDYANTRDENGDYIFAGFQSRAPAFSTDGAGNYIFNGDQGQQSIQIGSDRQVVASDSGAEIFQLVRTGNGDFAVDASRTNAGTGRISTGSVVDRASFLQHDYRVQFIDADNYQIVDDTSGTVVGASPRPYTDGATINFDGIALEIHGIPAAGDEFTIEASRYQDVFATLSELAREMDAPGTGNITGNLGGDYLANGFDAGDTVSFDLQFDGRTVSVSHLVDVADTNVDIGNAFLTSISTDPNVTDNGDGTFTLAGITPGLSTTFSVNAASGAIDFSSSGGNGEISSNLTLSNLADDNGSTAGVDASLLLANRGNTVASPATITVGETGQFIPGETSPSFLSQKIANALDNIDRVMDGMLNVQAKIGGRFNSIESQAADNEGMTVKLAEVRSEIEDLDLAEAISKLTFQTTALQVSQQTFVRIQGLSLFEYI